MSKYIQFYEEKYMRFPEGKYKALTLSYDDGVRADLHLMKILSDYGLKCTFNINTNRFDNRGKHDRLNEEETLAAYSNCGHEIALHGDRHVVMTKVPLPEAANEILRNRAYLERAFGRIVRGSAYAYGAYNEDVIKMLEALGVVYARTTKPTYSFDIPKNWLALDPTCHHKDERFKEVADRFLNDAPAIGTKHSEPWLFYLWGHAYEFDDDNNWDLIENFAARVAKSGGIWFATNIEVYDYVKAYESLIFSLDGERVKNPSAIPVWIELRGKIYKVNAGEELSFDVWE